MRPVLIALCLASPALAHEPVIDDCAISAAACPVEVLLPGLAPLDGSPLLTAPDRLTFLAHGGVGPVAAEVSLSDGQLLREVPLRLPKDADLYVGLVAAGGRGYALSLWHGGTELGLQFFAPDGAALGLLPASWPEGWPLEMSLATAITLLAGQGVLTFDGEELRGTLYRFDLAVSAADGALTVTETRSGTGAVDTLGAYLERRLARQIDPVGAEDVHVESALEAVTSWASDGSPSRLLLRSADGGEIAFDQRLGPDRMGHDYSAARVTPDGTRLAAIRTTATESRLMVFDTATTAPVFEAPLPIGCCASVVWLPQGRIAVLQVDGDEGARLLVFQTR
ncbi:hypothetical protein [Tabrizicola aquatica]|uniref:hypothetical protein n=1 Tax=Tabrizicola aquatica TaxID=909926 RepID=UPI000CD2054B|nr:hypothetical protein [Tabrizicola aquatica]